MIKNYKKKKKKFCFDLDGVICETHKNNYMSAKPIKKAIKLINRLYQENYIIIFTARYMGRNKDDVKKAEQQGYSKTYKQLIRWKVKFHELKMGKPSYDIFVDDKSLFFKKNWVDKF